MTMQVQKIRTKTELKEYFGVSIQTLRRWVYPLIKTEIIRYQGALSPMEVKIILWYLEGNLLPETLIEQEKIYLEKIKQFLSEKKQA